MSIQHERLLPIWEAIATDTELSWWVDKRDISLVRRRTAAEGLDFLTKTLPMLGKAVDRSFETGFLVLPDGYKKVVGQSVPVFLKKAFVELYDEDGLLRWYGGSPNGLINIPAFHETCANAAYCIRQLTLMFYKMHTTYTDRQVADTISSFERTDDEIGDLQIDPEQVVDGIALKTYLAKARSAISYLLCGVSPYDIMPKHGSGASSCGTKPWNRYGSPRYIPRLHKLYAYDEYFYTPTGFVDKLDEFLTGEEYEPCAKVVLVPKDSRGPRLISEEPRETMFIQQGQMTKLYEAIEANPNAKAMVSCIDQDRNRFLAQFASQTGSYATIDCKDASDRVSCQLVEALFPRDWVMALMASRSGMTELPDGRIRPLKKFAPMGSACCFPVEALCFWALSLAACARGPLLRELREHRRQAILPLLAVFGDDIIVPTSRVKRVIELLESVGLRINKDKCYTQGPFRESCGGDYYLGRDISVMRFTHPIVVIDDVGGVHASASSIDGVHHSMFRLKDFINKVVLRFGSGPVLHNLKSQFEEYFGPIPVIGGTSYGDPIRASNGLVLYGVTAETPPLGKQVRKKFRLYQKRSHPRYSVPEMYVLTEKAVNRKIDNSDWCHVMRSLLNQGGLRGTSMVTLAKRNQYKYGWVRV